MYQKDFDIIVPYILTWIALGGFIVIVFLTPSTYIFRKLISKVEHVLDTTPSEFENHLNNMTTDTKSEISETLFLTQHLFRNIYTSVYILVATFTIFAIIGAFITNAQYYRAENNNRPILLCSDSSNDDEARVCKLLNEARIKIVLVSVFTCLPVAIHLFFVIRKHIPLNDFIDSKLKNNKSIIIIQEYCKRESNERNNIHKKNK